MKWKVGDELMVRVRVIDVSGGVNYPYVIDFEGGLRRVQMPEESLASATLIKRPLAVGDRVACRSKSILMTIKAIDGEMAWVEALGDHWTVNLSELRRAE